MSLKGTLSAGRQRRELAKLQVRPQPLGCDSRVGRSSNHLSIQKYDPELEAWGLVRPDIGGSMCSVDFAEVVDPLRLPLGLELHFPIQTPSACPAL